MILRKVGMGFLALALVAVFVFATGNSVAYAQQCQKTSSVAIANQEGVEANIVITAYNPDGTENGEKFQDKIPANGSEGYFPLKNVEAGFKGSLVVSSDKDVAAIANVVCVDFAAGGSYVAGSSGSTTVKLPILNKNNGGFTTQFSAQNAGSATATVSASYSDGTSVNNVKIEPGAAHVFDQGAETHPQKNFAGTLTSDQPIVAAALQESADVIFAYTAFSTGGAEEPLFPLVNINNAGFVTGINIQNGGTQSTDVTVSYTPSSSANGKACTEKQTIPAGGAKAFAFLAFDATADITGITTDCDRGKKFVGSARVTANSASQPLIAVVNQLRGTQDGEAYGSFDVAEATNKVSMPLIMRRNGGFSTGINVMNAGTSATTVNCEFVNTTAKYSATLQPGEAMTKLQDDTSDPNAVFPDPYVGSGVCTGGAGSSIVAVVNELGSDSSKDQLLVYEGINR